MIRRLVVIASLLQVTDSLTRLLADEDATAFNATKDGERKLESDKWCKFRNRFPRTVFLSLTPTSSSPIIFAALRISCGLGKPPLRTGLRVGIKLRRTRGGA